MKTSTPIFSSPKPTRNDIFTHSYSTTSQNRVSTPSRRAPLANRLGSYEIYDSDHPATEKSLKHPTEDHFSDFNPAQNLILPRARPNPTHPRMNIENGRRPLHQRISTLETGPRGGTGKFRGGLRKFTPGAKLKIEIQNSTKPAFTLIELMAATTVLSVVLLMMVGMQDQMSKAWSNANRRTDATREARAACRLMARDFSYFLIRGTNISRNIMRAASVFDSPVPFYYFSGTGSIPTASLTMPTNVVTNSSYIFGVFPKKKSSPNDSDFSLVGYYIAQTNSRNVNGFFSTNCNLYRYYRTNNDAIVALSNWISAPTPQPNDLFPNISTASDEILARNACNLSIKVYGSTNSKNGLIYSNDYGGTANGIYLGNKIHVELSIYPDEVAQKLPSIAAWTNAANIQKSARTFEFNVDWPDSKE